MDHLHFEADAGIAPEVQEGPATPPEKRPEPPPPDESVSPGRD